MPYSVTTQRELRASFWELHPQFTRQGNRRQNAYPADVRMAFIDYIDFLHRTGGISDALAHRVAL